ncbi:MAG: ABC transporter substrate-binding protein [Alphaproteobacteria bacterium]|nr:ABC transporter substrate-binding protein [Alphaproteobacteria bacterium]
MKPRVLLGAAAIACMGFAAAAQPALAENVIRWGDQGDALTLDPMAQNEAPTTRMARQIYETLVTRDVQLALQPMIAESWDTIDPETWQFNLRKDAKFHDGTPLTAKDVVFSIKRAQSPNSDFKEHVNAIKSVEAKDDHTVILKTDGPNPILLSQLVSIFIMSEDWSKKHGVEVPQNYEDKEETYAARNTMGSGAYRVELREQDVRTVLVKNPDWWGWKKFPGNIDKIEFTPIANAATRVAALLSGELDIVTDAPLQDLKRVEATSGMKLSSVNQIRTIFFGMDQGSKELRSSNIKGKNPLADPKVREAMYRAIDITAIQKKVMRGLSIPAGIITPPGVHGYTEKLDERLGYDVDKAKALMAEAGYPDGFEIQLDCPNNRYNNDEAICQAAVAMLGKIGVKVALNAQPKSLHFPLLQNRQTDFYMLGWGVPTLDSHYVFDFLFDTDGSWNATGYSNAKVDEMTKAILTEVDKGKRDQMIADVWAQAKADNLYLPLHHQVIVWAMKDEYDVPIRANDETMFYYAVKK